MSGRTTLLIPLHANQVPSYSPLFQSEDCCWTSQHQRFPFTFQPKIYLWPSTSIRYVNTVLGLLINIIKHPFNFCFLKVNQPCLLIFTHVAFSQCLNSKHFLHFQYSRLDCTGTCIMLLIVFLFGNNILISSTLFSFFIYIYIYTQPPNLQICL